MPDRLLSPKEVAGELGVSVWTVYRLVKKGDLVAIRVGRLLRIPESSLEAFIDLNRKQHRLDLRFINSNAISLLQFL